MVTSRVFVLIIVFTCLSGILIYRLFSLQIVHGEEYLDGFKLKIRKERTMPVQEAIFMTVTESLWHIMSWRTPLR